MSHPDDWTLADLLPILDTAMCRQEEASEKILAEGCDPSALYHDASERLGEVCGQSDFREQWACQRGCGACCHQTVPVTPVEALQVAAFVGESLSAEDQQKLRARLHTNAEAYAEAASPGSQTRRIRCAFLDETGSCGVHAARPLRCRGFHSLSRAACEEVHEGRGDVVPVDPHTNASMRGAQSGLSGALSDSGLDGGYYELHSAVLRVLETTSAENRWKQGDDVFANCTHSVAVPDDVWIAPQEDGSVVKLRRTADADHRPALEAVIVGP